MINSFQLEYSESQFKGFHNTSIIVNNKGIEVNYYVPDNLKEEYEKKLVLEKFMANASNGYYDENSNDFYIIGKGAINWDDLASILYYEDKEPSYSFLVELKDRNQNKVYIKGNGSPEAKKNFLQKDNHQQYDDIIDNPQHPSTINFIEQKYLKETFNEIVAKIDPLVTDLLFNRYVTQMTAGKVVKFGQIEMKKDGLFLKAKSWLFSKKILIPWHQIKLKGNKKEIVIVDSENPKIACSILNKSFLNKGALQKIINWGKDKGA